MGSAAIYGEAKGEENGGGYGWFGVDVFLLHRSRLDYLVTLEVSAALQIHSFQTRARDLYPRPCVNRVSWLDSPTLLDFHEGFLKHLISH